MVIFVSENSKIHTIDSIGWKDEYEMQDFVVENSKIILSEFLDEDAKICAIGKELANGNGRADVIFLDQNGSLYIVETKLDSNTDKRQVFAQVTGYVSAVRNQCVYQTFDDFINDCERSIQNKFGFSGTFNEYIRQKFEIDEKTANEIKTNLKNNIEEQSIFCIIVMDAIDNSLKMDIDNYLIKHLKICGVELQKYPAESNSFFVVPHYYGIEKLFLNEKHTTKWYKEHVQGWHFFNNAIQDSQKLDENTKKNILKITNSLENITDSDGWVKKATNKLEIYFKKFGDYEYHVLNIYENGTFSFHLNAFKDNPKLGQDFKNQLSEIDPIFKKEIEDKSKYYKIKHERWTPKIDEFIALFKKIYS